MSGRSRMAARLRLLLLPGILALPLPVAAAPDSPHAVLHDRLWELPPGSCAAETDLFTDWTVEVWGIPTIPMYEEHPEDEIAEVSIALFQDNTAGSSRNERGFFLGGARPNPFNPTVWIPYSTAHPGHVKLGVYDVRGRLVRKRVGGWVEDGSHEIRWDGTDEGGREVPSGVYFCRLSAGEESATKRAVAIR